MKILMAVIFISAFFVALLAWFRVIKNMIIISKHVTHAALLKYSWVRVNHLNAVFYLDALDSKGKQAKKNIVLNTGLFIGSIEISFLTVYVGGIAT